MKTKSYKSGFLSSSLDLLVTQQCKDTTRRCISLIGSCIEGNKSVQFIDNSLFNCYVVSGSMKAHKPSYNRSKLIHLLSVLYYGG